MGLKINQNDISKIKYNNDNISHIKYNGEILKSYEPMGEIIDTKTKEVLGTFSKSFIEKGYFDSKNIISQCLKKTPSSSYLDIVIPEGVTRIAQRAFYGTSGYYLNVSFPDSLELILPYAFQVSGIQNINLTNIRTIAPYAFAQCYKLDKVVIKSDNLEKTGLGAYCFYQSRISTSMTIITNKLIVIPSAFCYGGYIQGFVVNNGIETINSGAFQSAQLPYFGWYVYKNGSNSYLTIQWFLDVKNIASAAFVYATIPQELRLKNTEYIDRQAFAYGNKQKIIIPSSVTFIGNNAFQNVTSIVYSGSATGAPWGASNYSTS